ncbi:hypothetical protein NDU88_008040 [Pleurodeles waltl]|uniref:Myb/SANT-like DNA-binding domain-containing protein n=1 Tax=Pleurodeles waltl TaxID=8319 RepID=A0AAV7QQJ6_PLEWA|nr:hypothetical protein NDU88_008040 [Pleurodeles waltl]
MMRTAADVTAADVTVSAHQKRDMWRAIAKEVRTLGAHQRRGTHCRKRWEDIRRCSKKTAEAQLGMASQRGRGARRTMTPLMFRILAVAYPELDGRLRTSQQTQGVGEGRGGGWGVECVCPCVFGSPLPYVVSAVLTVVFAAGVDDPRRGAGRLALAEYEVPAPWCPPSSWSV